MSAASMPVRRAFPPAISLRDVIKAFPHPQAVRIADIAARFGCGYDQASTLRALAAENATEVTLMQRHQLSRSEAVAALAAGLLTP